MSDNWECPICGSTYKLDELNYSCRDKTCWRQYVGVPGYTGINCKHYGITFLIEPYILDDMDHEAELREKILNLALEHTLKSEFCEADGRRTRWCFSYDDGKEALPMVSHQYVNLAKKIKDYPASPVDVAHRVLENLSLHYPEYGCTIGIDSREFRLFFRRKNTEFYGLFRLLQDFNYVKETEYRGVYSITAVGWQKIEELRKNEQVTQQGFIAMIFREEAKPIREAFKKAIEKCGYHPMILDEKEHNNQIVPEIFYEIKRSKFAVVDVTYPSLGAYYEAGYAQALGKEVIVCCREDIFHDPTNRPHFDIAQKAIITWKDEGELVERLKRRIEATVT